MHPYPPMGEAIEFLLLLWAVDHDLQQKSVAMQRSMGVTGPQRLVIRIVGRFPGISPGQVAGLLGAHPSTATGLTQRLVKSGLLLTRPDRHDARRIRLGLTPRGRAIEKASVGTIEESVAQLLASSSPAEIAAARTMLGRLRAILQQESDAGTARTRAGAKPARTARPARPARG